MHPVNCKALTPLLTSMRDARGHMAVVAVLLALRSVCSALSPREDVRAAREWNANLPNLELENVSVTGDSIQQAWMDISTKYLLRSVLYVSDPAASHTPFSFDQQKCTGGDLLNALTAAYTNFTWSVDDDTGVIWLHPRDVAYDSILPLRVSITNDLLGVPMQSGILEPLSERFPQALLVKRWGTLFMNTFDYSVSLPHGSHCLRDVLNYCCCAHPITTFYIFSLPKGSCVVQAVNLVSSAVTSPPPGIGFWWKTEMGNLKTRSPDISNLVDALADPNPEVRGSARVYLEALSFQTPDDEVLLSSAAPYTKAVWAALGAMSVRVRTSDAISTAGLAVLDKGYSENLFSQGDPRLAVLAAFELAREADDTKALDIVMKRRLPKGTLDEIRPELSWLALKSDRVRTKMIEVSPKWEDFSADDLKADLKAIADLRKGKD